MRFFLIFLWLFCLTAKADIKISPIKIKSKENIILLANNQAWYLIHNQAKEKIFLQAVIARPGASAGWSTMIAPDHWSLLALNNKKLTFACQIQQGEKIKAVPCKKVLLIYSAHARDFKNSNKGSYWLADNKLWTQLSRAAKRRGVIF